MKRFLHAYHLKPAAVMLITLPFFMLPGCNPDRRSDSSLQGRFHFSEQLALNSFIDYTHTISSPDFPLASFKSNSNLHQQAIYAQKIQSEEDLQFFPAILWQIYALNGETKWKQIAENYSTVLYQDHLIEKLTYAEAILHVYLNRYLADRSQSSRSSLLDILSQYVAKNEKKQALSCDATTNRHVCIEQLLENQLLFFASTETGDPVYAQLAQQNSDLIFEHYFQNKQFNELHYALANCQAVPDIHKLGALSSEDLYHLAIIFYGFTILNDQQANERYHSLCVRLAGLFTSIFDEIDAGSTVTNAQQELLANKMDLLSRTLVCLALHKFEASSDNQNRIMANKIFNQILDKLNRPDEEKNGEYSSRMYYYLFEFFQKSNSL